MLAEVDQDEAPELIAGMGVRKLCPCGKMFTPYRSFQHYHSNACRAKFEGLRPSRYVKRPVTARVCPQCGTTFESNDSKKVYCTNACYLAHEAARHVRVEERTCLSCGEKFMTTHWSKRYCSKDCRREARRAR